MKRRTQPIVLLHTTTVPQSLRPFLRGQIEFMKDRGFDVHALSAPGALLTEFSQHERVSVHEVSMVRRITPFRDLVALAKMVKVLWQVKPAIVHGHTPKGGLLGILAAWLTRTPIRIYTIHGLWYVSGLGWKGKLLRYTEKISCKLSHRVLAVSPSVRQRAIEDGLCSADKIHAIGSGSSNGIDAAGRFNPATLPKGRRNEVRDKYNIPRDAVVIGFVGRIFRVKGVVELGSAWQELREQFPESHLMFVGAPDPQSPIPAHVEQQLREDDRVHFTGKVTDTPGYYAAMDLFVMPSYQEGFGAVLAEAAAMELPTVSTKVLGCVDAVEDGVTGTLVPPRAVAPLRDSIERYLSNPTLREQHGIAGRQRVLREFRQQDIWEGIYQEYVQLMNEKGIQDSVVDGSGS